MSTDPNTKSPAPNADLTEIGIGAAMKVLNTLRPGLDEMLYDRALVIELREQGVDCEQQKQHEVSTKGSSLAHESPT